MSQHLYHISTRKIFLARVTLRCSTSWFSHFSVVVSSPSPAFPARAPQDYKECFTAMVDDPAFQNVAARMLTGHDAYEGSAELCTDKRQTREVGGGDGCAADVEDVIHGACNLNFVAMW